MADNAGAGSSQQQGSMPPGFAAHGAEAQKFNSWVIGGGYSKAQMKRNQIRTDLAVQKRHASAPSAAGGAETPTSKAAERRSALKEAAKPIQPYKPKFAEAMRDERRRQAEEAFANRRAGSPHKPTSEQERLHHAIEVYRSEHPEDPHDGPAELRDRLKQSFEGTVRAQPTATLFPPLLQPYSRPMTFLRGRERSKPREAPQLTFPSPPGTASPPSPSNQEPFGLPGPERRRAHPSSGPQAFLPTGSSTTAYRHFTNYGLLARTSAANVDGFALSGSAPGM
uniref:Uncharacterized protein n=1 Tax=Neobodo designis TaxID=312471 RepID=A0A7S1KWL0_NEODS